MKSALILTLTSLFVLFACACEKPSPVKAATGPVWHLGESVIDSHVHIYPTMTGLSTALTVFDKVGIDRFVIKSAGEVGTAKYQASLAMEKILKGRMRSFANLDWTAVEKPGWVQEQVAALEQMKKDGIVGIKIFKNLGLHVRVADGTLLKLDDPRLDPIWEACGRLGLIVAWHVADPVAFFKPVTPDNERYEELKIAQGWSFFGKDYPSHDELLEARGRVMKRHLKTTFLLIHLAEYPEKLEYVDKLLDTNPNVFIDVSARVPEIGRHPADQVRKFFVKHQDRILFGSDFISSGDGTMQLGSVSATEPGIDDAVIFFERHWRFFETADKQIDHPTPIQGNWKVDAVNLPPDVLKKFYVTNAERLIFSR
jgi:predicted TIM-barrel fold metal-dependent hydrolase